MKFFTLTVLYVSIFSFMDTTLLLMLYVSVLFFIVWSTINLYAKYVGVWIISRIDTLLSAPLYFALLLLLF